MTPPAEPLFRLPQLYSDPVRSTLFSLAKPALSGALRLADFNRGYAEIKSVYGDEDFLTSLLDWLEIACEPDETALARIPAEGPCLVVSNHPYGAIEGVILAWVLGKVRPDARLMANYILGMIPEMRPHLILVDPFGATESAQKNIGPLKQSVRWLKDGHMLGVFPAGEVSSFNFSTRSVTDPAWSPTVARIARMAKADVLPIHFPGGNGTLFNLLGLIHPRLRTLMLPRELLNKRGASIVPRIGEVVPYARLAEFADDRTMIDYLRLRTYSLADAAKTPRPGARGLAKAAIVKAAASIQGVTKVAPGKKEPAKLVRAIAPGALRHEVEALPKDRLLAESGALRVFWMRRREAPLLMREIGRLRELTFREVGEGSGKPLDVDRFDAHYDQIVLWNHETGEVVGGYRVGRTDEIIERFGPRGLYTSTLFKYKRPLLDKITPALEMGRSFIRKEYQRSYAPLLLLWKGIGRYACRLGRYKTLFGPVSISKEYLALSREVMVRWLETAGQSEEASVLADLVRPKSPPRLVNMRRLGCSDELLLAIKDLEAMTELVSELEADRKGAPVLLRQYLKLGGKILAFNVDKAFGDCIDGLILVDLTQTERKTLDRYMGKDEAAAFLANHGANHGANHADSKSAGTNKAA